MAARRGRGARSRARPGRWVSRGQSTVEFALVLPLFFGLLALLFQVALVARDEILVVHAARAAVREASVTPDPTRIAAAARRALPGAVVRVTHRGAVGATVEVDVTSVAVTDLPLVGALLPDLTLHAHAVMRVER
jgi:Flp pilus assembly protein TadG